MTGPSQSIIACWTGIGHGAAAWITVRNDERWYLLLTASGKRSKRMNIVGTIWTAVTRHRSTAARNASGSNLPIITTVPPSAWTATTNAIGEAW